MCEYLNIISKVTLTETQITRATQRLNKLHIYVLNFRFMHYNLMAELPVGFFAGMDNITHM